MSQEKVDRYKEYKRNKDKILKREKLMRRIEIAVAAVVIALFVCWFAWSAYNTVTRSGDETAQAEPITELNADGYTDYLGGLQSTFTE